LEKIRKWKTQGGALGELKDPTHEYGLGKSFSEGEKSRTSKVYEERALLIIKEISLLI